MDDLTISIVGIDYPNEDKSKSNRRVELLLCMPGEPVELRREQKTEYGPISVSVWSLRGVQIGYVSAQRTLLISRMMQHADAAAAFEALYRK